MQKCCIPYISCQSLLLSTTALNIYFEIFLSTAQHLVLRVYACEHGGEELMKMSGCVGSGG